MKVRQTLLGQAVRFLIDKEYGANHSINYKLLEEIKNRYYFMQCPVTIDDFNINSGITFYHGTLNDNVPIERLQIFKNALLCESTSDLEECDNFLDDVTQLASDMLGSDVEENTEFSRKYISQLEIELDGSLQKITDIFNTVGESISTQIAKYDNTLEKYQLASISWSSAPREGGVKTEQFKIEERVGYPRAEKIYYSIAPLKTKHHIEVLNYLEGLLLA